MEGANRASTRESATTGLQLNLSQQDIILKVSIIKIT